MIFFVFPGRAHMTCAASRMCALRDLVLLHKLVSNIHKQEAVCRQF